MLKITKNYLPSKKFLISLSVAVFIILIAIIINFSKTNTTNYINVEPTIDNKSALMKIDLDSDGLPDWKENLYGTDPHKADTDGDGTNDNDEISLDRDPLVPNTAKNVAEPTDKISLALIEENKKLLEDYQKLNERDKFSRDLLSNIIASQPLNGSMSQAQIDSLVEKTLSDLPEKNYTNLTKIQDLTLLKTNNEDMTKKLADYVKSFYTETQKIKLIFGSDINLINSYSLKGDVSVKPEMLKVIDKYQNIVDNLIKMPVPVAIGYYDVNYHLLVINNLEQMIAVDEDIINSDKTSFAIFSNLAIYNSAMTNLFNTLIQVDKILNIKR